MRVQLFAATPDFLRTIWLAARTCYSALSPLELSETEPAREEQLRIAGRIIQSKHLSVLEHCHLTYGVEGVSRTLLAQYSRHRIGVSLSVQSQRYVSEGSERNGGLFDLVTPPAAADGPAADIFATAMSQAQAAYDALLAVGLRKEDARFVLPGAAATNFVTSVNLRSLLDVYHKRVTVPGAQWEIRELLERMVALLLEREPWLEPYFVEQEAGTHGPEV